MMAAAKTRTTPERELWKCRGCGKRGKPKAGFPSFHSPLGISPTTGEIPTFPQLRRKQADGRVENQKRVSHFPTATNPISPEPRTGPRAGFALCPAAGASRRPKSQRVIVVDREK
jgi:hypothetical protein